MKALILAFAILGIVLAVAAGFVYAGYYDVAADATHWGATSGFIASARERSIARQSAGVGSPPALDDPALVAIGAEHYDEMCVSCHLAPGMKDTEISAALNPKPPRLAERDENRSPEQYFWVIKHGIKMTGMPAWGMTHDDHVIWGMVAFLQKLPGLSRPDYDALVGKGGADGHSNEEGAADHEHEHHEGVEPAHEHTHEDADHHSGG